MVGDIEKVYKQHNLSFIITPEKIFVRTSLQAFSLEPKAHYWQKRMRLVRIMIELDQIQTLSDLAEWTRPGIEWKIIRNV